MDLLEAVVLSELLRIPHTRRVLLQRTSRRRQDEDQRSVPDLDELVAFVRRPPTDTADQVGETRREAERLLRSATRLGVQAVPFGETRYPDLLATISDPPPVLWFAGDVQTCSGPAVAIVGSRAGSPYACEMAERLGSELSDRGVTVVSGLARGVDAAAHRGALRGRGGTVAVLGSGVDVVYPPEHVPLARSIASTGSMVSELGPGAAPLPVNFPRRNRIISGLSLAVVVVEASDRSGSLITARLAADQGREVMAVPGNVLTGRSRGGHALIKDGAKVVENADDILEEIGPHLCGRGQDTSQAPDEADFLLGLMDRGESYDLDRLAALSGLDGGALLPRLLELELQGLLVRSSTGRFSRFRG